jgi:hypothetical protein
MREGMRGRWEGGNSTHTAASTARDTNSALDTAAEPTWGGLHSKARGGGAGGHTAMSEPPMPVKASTSPI